MEEDLPQAHPEQCYTPFHNRVAFSNLFYILLGSEVSCSAVCARSLGERGASLASRRIGHHGPDALLVTGVGLPTTPPLGKEHAM